MTQMAVTNRLAFLYANVFESAQIRPAFKDFRDVYSRVRLCLVRAWV